MANRAGMQATLEFYDEKNNGLLDTNATVGKCQPPGRTLDPGVGHAMIFENLKIVKRL